MKNKSFEKYIYTRSIFLIVVGVLTPLLVSNYFIYKEYNNKKISLVSSVVDINHSSLSSDIFENNSFSTHRILNRICFDMDVSQCTLVNTDGIELYHHSTPNLSNADTSKIDYQLIHAGRKVATLRLGFINKSILHIVSEKPKELTFTLIFLILIIVLFVIFIKKPLAVLSSSITELGSTEKSPVKSSGEFLEVSMMKSRLSDLISERDNEMQKNLELNQKKALFNQSKQLAHDIRSPLAALDMSIKSLDKVDPSQKQLIRSAINRIHDIANNLVGKNESINREGKISSTLLSSVIASIVSEKRTEFRNMNNIEINFPFSTENYGLFSNIEPSDLKRIISNLINNAVEATIESGEVELTLMSDPSQNKIIISDNGKGISEENIERIFDEGVSIDKEDGTGLGLFHAKNTIESWGGSITCRSVLGEGTSFEIALPKSNAPKSFVQKIQLEPRSELVIVDDDSSIHQVWKGRLDSLRISIDSAIFSSPEKFLSWYESHKNTNQVFVLDYEFLGHKLNGLDLVSKIESENIYLVTSRFEEKHIKEQAESKGIKLVDKGMLGFVPIELNEIKNKKVILIDDDEIIHMSWQMEAKAKNIDLECFSSIEAFLESSKFYSKDTRIYIDSNLKNDVKGEVESEKIFNEGFTELYIATGYSASDIDKPAWIKEVVGKRASF